MTNKSVLALVVLLLMVRARISNGGIHHEEVVIHDTCKKTRMYGHCVQAVHSYELFKYTNHSTPFKIASILVYVTGVQQAFDTLKRIDELILLSRRESLDYNCNLKACKEKYERIYDTDYFSAWVNMKNGNYEVSERSMWSARERANSCERGFDQARKYPITDMNDKLRMLSSMAAQVLRLLN